MFTRPFWNEPSSRWCLLAATVIRALASRHPHLAKVREVIIDVIDYEIIRYVHKIFFYPVFHIEIRELRNHVEGGNFWNFLKTSQFYQVKQFVHLIEVVLE